MKTKVKNYNRIKNIAIQLQFNPHFLFNTLQLINSKVMEREENSEIITLINILSKLLRSSLDIENVSVPFGCELEYAKMYIQIQHIKYGERFKIEWMIDYNTYNINVTKFCLQPLIENAIFHGILLSKENGIIRIASSIENKCLIVRVSNTGRKIPEDKLIDIQKKMDTEEIWIGKSIGLINLNQRIKAVFGEAYGCVIRSDDNFTEVKMSFPFNTKD